MLFTVSSVLFFPHCLESYLQDRVHYCKLSYFQNCSLSISAAKHVYGEHSFHTLEPLSHACGSNDSSSLSRQMCVSIITAELSRAAWTLRQRRLGSDLFSFPFKISNPTRNRGMRSNIPHLNNESPDVCCSTPWSTASQGGKYVLNADFCFLKTFLESEISPASLRGTARIRSNPSCVPCSLFSGRVGHFMVYHHPKK